MKLNLPVMIKTSAFVLLISVVSLMGCFKDKNIKLLELNKPLEGIYKQIKSDTSALSKFPLCDLAPEIIWDKVGIVSPYITEGRLEAAGIENYGDVPDIIYIHDSKYSLLFLKENHIVGHGIADRGILDLSSMVLLKSVVYIHYKDCDKLQIRKFGSEFQWLFANKHTRPYAGY